MAKYLVTGHNGFLGNQVVPLLKQTAELITVGWDADIIIEDIGKPFHLDTDIIDVVIHMAGKAHSVPKTETEAESFFKVNFDGTKNLCNALQEANITPKSFIFISTVAVYGKDEGTLIKENSPLDGVTPYAKSKILAEGWLKSWAAENNVTLGILRLPLVAGINPPGNLGAMIKGITSGRYFSIGKADARKSVVWAEDIVKIVPALAENGGTYNLTDGHHPSLKELEDCISGALKTKPPIKISNATAKMLGLAGNILGSRSPINSDKIKKLTSTLTFDDSLAVQALNWKPSPVLEKLYQSLCSTR